MSAPIDEAFAGLDEVWVWPGPPSGNDVAVTRLGLRDDDGRVEIVSYRQRAVGGVAHRMRGVGAWQRHDVGELKMPVHTGDSRSFDARPRSGDVRGRWAIGGRFDVGELHGASAIASRGRPPRSVEDWRDVASSALDVGRSLMRFARGDRSALDVEPVPPLGEAIESPLTALDGWLTAHQHLTRDGDESWRLVVDPGKPAPASTGLAFVIAGLGLVHLPQLIYR